MLPLLSFGAMYCQSSSDVPGHSTTCATSWSGTHSVTITDDYYQMTAFTLDIPDGWKFAGTIARDRGCYARGASLKYSVQSPDGLTGTVMMPGLQWSWSSDPQMQRIMEANHCPGIDIDTAAAFLLNIVVPNFRPGAKVIEVLAPPPENQALLADQLQKAREQNAAMARQFNLPPQKLNIDGARVRLQYERGGQPVEEMISTVIDCNESTTPAMFQRPVSMRRMCSARGIIATHAPLGLLDAMIPQFQSLGKSIKMDPAWSFRLQADQQAAFQRAQAENNRQFQATMQQSREAHDRLMANGRAFQQNMRASTDRALANDRARQAAIDASAHATVLHSLDQAEYRNPSTGEVVRASNQYNHQWMSSDGSTLIQTNDHTFDPNGQVYPVSQSWTELIPK